jgi:hypothetical protein
MYLESSILISFCLDIIFLSPLWALLLSWYCLALMFLRVLIVNCFKKVTSFSSKSLSLRVLNLTESYWTLSRGMNCASSWIISRVARIISRCFSLAHTHNISTISAEKYCSWNANSFNISSDLLMSSTWGFSRNMNWTIFSLIIHWEYFSKLSHLE